MTTKEKIETDLKAALKSRDVLKTSVLRLLLSDIHNQEIEKRGELSESDILAVLGGSVKKHRDSIAQFETGGRSDLVTKETRELRVIESYLPLPLSEEELLDLVRKTINEAKAGDPKDFGKVMRELMPHLKGRADGNLVSAIVREELQKDAP